MNSVKFFSLILSLIMIFSFAACSTNKDTSSTSSKIDNDDLIQYDITPNKPDKVASAAADHKPESGYDYKKENNVIAPDENTQAYGFSLTTTDEKSNETKNLVYVYHEQGELNVLEIDVLVKDATDADIDAAVKLLRELISSSFENFPMNDVEKYLPLSTAKIKELRFNNEPVSETVYGTDSNISISFDYYPNGCTLFFRIEL